MKIGSFFKLVEIQTKVASVIPYLLGTVFALYKYDDFKITNAILLFSSMLIFDMTTTAINNYIDYKKAVKKEGFGYEEHNAIVKDSLNPNMVKGLIISMLVISSLLGILLFLNTDIIVLLIGMICFAIGVAYSFGPIPISRTPFGEIFSGFTMGFFITFLAIYVHVFDENIITLGLTDGRLNLGINLAVIVSLVIVTIPAIMGIANIMLANNICDIDDDFENRRFTLPQYIGKDNALLVFKWLYYIGFIAIIIGVVARVLPITSILALVAIKPVNENIKKFFEVQTKKDTFVLAVKNFVLTNIIYIGTIILGVILGLV
ncbi:1,4-dihydroxy-2-naphthoate polyprenyltransferase [Clostridium paraputrificum]|uniref:1,4-dihydroxy-2-naphthoate polyprenyltransferase n=1 Tax=Clostridium TaxID=1485 RepID=UPI003D32E1E8